MKAYFYPSVMCMNCRTRLQEGIADFENIGVNGFHVDIMDGIFVDDIAPVDRLVSIRKLTALPLGVHVMVRNPLEYLEQLYKERPETIYVHFEAEDPATCLKDIREHGCLTGLAVCPETTADAITELLPMVDRVLLLRVPPGTSGHPPILHVDEKMQRLLHTPGRHFDIVCDGAISPEFVKTWCPQGIRHFVCGKASGLFANATDRRTNFERMKAASRM